MLHCMLQCMSCVRSLFYEDTKSTGQYEWQQECPLSRTYKIWRWAPRLAQRASRAPQACQPRSGTTVTLCSDCGVHNCGFTCLQLKAKGGNAVPVLQTSSPDSDCSFTSVADLAQVSGAHSIYLTFTDIELWSRDTGASTEHGMQLDAAACCRTQIGVHILEAGT